MQITKEQLTFMEEAKNAFESDAQLETHRDWNESYIALRTGDNRDCIMVYKIDDYVANFAYLLEPSPKPSKEVMNAAYKAEQQLKLSRERNKEHHQDLTGAIYSLVDLLRKELIKLERDEVGIRILCAGIVNIALLISDKEGNPL